jgi:hypothetical protein
MSDGPKTKATDGEQVTCAKCGRRTRLSPDVRMQPPAGWFIVRSRALAGAAEERAFCSRKCMGGAD